MVCGGSWVGPLEAFQLVLTGAEKLNDIWVIKKKGTFHSLSSKFMYFFLFKETTSPKHFAIVFQIGLVSWQFLLSPV